MFDSSYKFNLVDRKNNPDPDILCIWKYNFKSAIRRYIITVELYQHNIYILKYHAACHSKCENKFSLLFNDEKPAPIIKTCVDVMISFYNANNLASFGFIGANSVNKKRKSTIITEGKSNTQRFRIYKLLMFNYFGKETFAHAINKKYSAYLMINRGNGKIRAFRRQAQALFSTLYINLYF